MVYFRQTAVAKSIALSEHNSCYDGNDDGEEERSSPRTHGELHEVLRIRCAKGREAAEWSIHYGRKGK